jgi:hypothetical protein
VAQHGDALEDERDKPVEINANPALASLAKSGSTLIPRKERADNVNTNVRECKN